MVLIFVVGTAAITRRGAVHLNMNATGIISEIVTTMGLETAFIGRKLAHPTQVRAKEAIKTTFRGCVCNVCETNMPFADISGGILRVLFQYVTDERQLWR